jgi:hypothetical protein
MARALTSAIAAMCRAECGFEVSPTHPIILCFRLRFKCLTIYGQTLTAHETIFMVRAA